MILLPSTFKRKGFEYKLIKRWDCPDTKKGIAILEQYQEGDLIAFEVVKIQKQFKDEKGPGGVVFAAKERVPSDGMWGTEGWTFALFGNKEQARELASIRFSELKQKIEDI